MESSGLSPKPSKRRKAPVAAPLTSRALIVEDDAILAMMVADSLRDCGIGQISVCPAIGAALAELDRLKPDVLVLDVQLTDRDDGWALAELVLELAPDPPVIVFSTGTPERIPERIALRGTVLAKPYTSQQLIDAVRSKASRSLLSRLRNVLGNAFG